MSDITAYDSEEELHDNLREVDDLLADLRRQQQENEQERWVLNEQVQGAIAILEKRVSDYEQRRDQLDRSQVDLRVEIPKAEENRRILQLQLDAKQDAKQARKRTSPSGDEFNASAADQAKAKTSGKPVTKADVEKLEEQMNRPKAELHLTPPGGGAQASTVDADLKRMGDALREKKEKLGGASQDLRTNWDRHTGPKR